MNYKKAIIFDHGGGELANQLWNYISIYSYTLETGYQLENPSFYEYADFFTIPNTKNIFSSFFKDDTSRKFILKKRFFRNLYKFYILYIKYFYKKNIISSLNANNIPTYLKKHDANPLYLRGWLFRNPIGLEKYHNEILHYFKPRKDIEEKVQTQISILRQKYSHIVGLHIRQGDYVTWKNGIYYIPQKRIREIINEYISFSNITTSEVVFIITSDGKIDSDNFNGLNFVISDGNMATDLFLLAACNIVIGSDSSFGDFAAYYGNIPHIILKKETIDWHYYKDKKEFFENKYCTMVHY